VRCAKLFACANRLIVADKLMKGFIGSANIDTFAPLRATSRRRLPEPLGPLSGALLA
jgi:hypothetical protein